MKNPRWLLNFKYNVFSQNGEDGIIEKILDIIPDKNKFCVEFGAWDGVFLSNTRNLILNRGYSAVLIEADKEKFKELKNNYIYNPSVITLNKFVGFNNNDNLDIILKDVSIPVDFDFLSIDVDGNDYHIWNAIQYYKPKLVCIEYNPTIPVEIDFVQPADYSINQGCSLLSLVRLGKAKGYELISTCFVNAFFVKKEYFSLFDITDNSPEALQTHSDFITYIFWGYDGTIFLRGFKKSIWHHGLELDETKIQLLPPDLRKYPECYTNEEKELYQRWLEKTKK
ncbi:MAG: hypothetical protein QXP66_00940 [Candidatus Aenigmatarchaeota archaeon]